MIIDYIIILIVQMWKLIFNQGKQLAKNHISCNHSEKTMLYLKAIDREATVHSQ